MIVTLNFYQNFYVAIIWLLTVGNNLDIFVLKLVIESNDYYKKLF